MKKVLSILLALVLWGSVALSVPLTAYGQTLQCSAGGWNETLWVQIPDLKDDDVLSVSYIGPLNGSLTGQDLTYLVRDMDGGVRIDIPGLPAGSYTLTIGTNRGQLQQSGIQVEAQDRSGYAHFGEEVGVGAYTNEGRLKDNAIVLYVTEENKDTVTLTFKDGTTVRGIGNILNTVGMDVGNGKNSKGGIANTNQDILRKLAADGTPLVVRILGRVTLPAGLTAYDSVDYGGSKGDNGAMARMSGGKDITIEGIGTDAVIDGWGLHFICQTSDYVKGWGRSFEVRNLSFYNVPEDCLGMEGQQESNVLTAPVERCWIHHCAFYGPTIQNPAESDKSGGDGACDFKRGQYFTNSYCYYEGYHKTNLVGSSDSSLQYHMTYHHNYWKNCESRGPLARQANIHMYNNIFEGQRSYCMSLRANSYIFSEYNLFLQCKNVCDSKTGGVCKSLGNQFTNCSGTNSTALVVVQDRNAVVESKNRYAKFELDSTLSYIPAGEYRLQEDLQKMQNLVLASAGPQGGIGGQLPPVEPEPGQGGGEQVEFPAGSYVHDFTQDGLQSQFFTISGNLSTSKGTVNFAGLTLTRCLKIESSTSIRFVAPTAGTLTLVFGGNTNASGKTIKVDGQKCTIGQEQVMTVQVSAGSHEITKGDSINLFYMVYSSHQPEQPPHTHSYEAVVVIEPDCLQPGLEEYVCQCGDSYTQQLSALGHDLLQQTVQSTCTQEGYVRSYCSRCQESQSQTLQPLGHDYGAWEVVREPAVGQEGLEQCVCTRCADIRSQSIPALPAPEPTQPTQPTQPSAPTQPTQPTTGTKPTQPETSTQPTAPGQSVQTPQPQRNGWIWVGIAALVVAAGVGILVRKKK